MARLKVTQKKGIVGEKHSARETLRTLGLKRIGDVVVKEDRPEIRGWSGRSSTWWSSRRSTEHGRQRQEWRRAAGATR